MENTSAVDIAARILAEEAHGATSSEEWAAVTTRINDQIARTLSPIIGEAGFLALFARSIKKIKPGFPCLQGVVTTAPPEVWRAQLLACLSQQEPALIRDISVTLLAVFFKSLSTFIGDGLTWRLFQNAWPRLVVMSEPEPVEKS